MKVIHYVNQFFAGVGGEDHANVGFDHRPAPVGPGMLLKSLLESSGEETVEIVTASCGDTYAAEHIEAVFDEMVELVERERPSVIVLGPAFNAGRYGLICGELAARLPARTGVPAITGLYEENAGVGLFRSRAVIVRSGPSAADMRSSMTKIASRIPRLLAGESFDGDDEVYGSERRRNVRADDIAAHRAVSMLLQLLDNVDVGTELAVPDVEPIAVPEPVTDLAHATVALVTEGGLVPRDNPDRLTTGASERWGAYPLSELLSSPGSFQSIHGGFDTKHVNDSPFRLVPIDIVADLVDQGVIGKLHPYYYVTSGTATKVENCRMMGSQIAEVLRNDGVHAVIVTST